MLAWQVLAPDHACLWCFVLFPTSKPRIDLRAPFVSLQGRHGPGIQQRTGQFWMKRRRCRGCGNEIGASVPEVAQRGRAGVAAFILPARQLIEGGQTRLKNRSFPFRLLPCRPPRVGLRLGRVHRKHVHGCRPVLPTSAIHPSETLNHALPSYEIAHHMVCVEVYPDLTGRRSNENNRQARRGVRTSEKSVLLQPHLQILPFVDSSFADQHLGLMSKARLSCWLESPIDPSLHLPSIPPAMAVDQHACRTFPAPEHHGSLGKALW